MTGQVRHPKVAGGRFYARIAVPKALQPIIGRTGLIQPIGGEWSGAVRLLPGAVAEPRRLITKPERQAGQSAEVARYLIVPAQLAASHHARHDRLHDLA
ncbi:MULTISPECIES: hypothetical protein [unclassified Paracoccus (in: a-proteobacteria)]|uniref:hypothetical protein n=1 Tax=unclassified Paracoccus (in: a-proteobacteria) TaxID=2688777 RepID=UPI001603FF2F|nr:MULTISPECIES: hypothetical protein [unclassified Paracoccus (in: a-proteobacteria)]MBB1490639.1 hypothetical protein [Paracoccus sp. MC1854]MBB1497518.1 hypothetical protein [Paracoccus sp. MC1862]QQO45990.1 hypothetical protein JGR78_06835 [Paracoccus sp. MC1862]